MIHRLSGCIAALTLLLGATAASAEKPPPNSKPLSEIAIGVERAGCAPIEEASFDDGRWEIEAYQAEAKFELRVDPMSGEITSKRADD